MALLQTAVFLSNEGPGLRKASGQEMEAIRIGQEEGTRTVNLADIPQGPGGHDTQGGHPFQEHEGGVDGAAQLSVG